MTSLTFDRSFECAPHATRSVAMALTLSLNIAIVLFALRPSTPLTLHAPPPPSILAAVLQPPPTPIEPPAVPTLNVVKHVAVPSIAVPVAHPLPVPSPTLPAISPVAPVQALNRISTSGTGATAAAGDANATIAYETATPPAYPIQALRAGIEGTVLLRVLVDTSGKPIEVVVDRSSGSRQLDAAARKHVLATWRFHPAMRDGHAIKAWALVPVRFDLERG